MKCKIFERKALSLQKKLIAVIMKPERLDIRTEMLEWAVTRSGQSVGQYAQKNPAFAKWINEEQRPTFKQLENFAKSVYVPLGYLFLESPPAESIPIPMFRSGGGSVSLNVLDEVRTVQERQEWLSSYLVENGVERPYYVGSKTIATPIEETCQAIRDILGLTLDWAFKEYSIGDAIRRLVSRMEDAGTMVCINNMVGNNIHRKISVSDCRGFALIDRNAPFIFINGGDAQVAQTFTLIHEFAHVMIGYESGVGDEDSIVLSSDSERYCDKVAAFFLVPEGLFRQVWTIDTDEAYANLAKRFKVSRYTIARRATELGLISSARQFQLFNLWKNEPIPHIERSGHPTFRTLALRRISPTFMIHLSNAAHASKILYLDAYRLAGLKGDTFHNVVGDNKQIVR